MPPRKQSKWSNQLSLCQLDDWKTKRELNTAQQNQDETHIPLKNGSNNKQWINNSISVLVKQTLEYDQEMPQLQIADQLIHTII